MKGVSVGYDVIGDIHGQAGKLEALLKKLGYVQKIGGWLPPQGRQALFLGDLIDRGPEQVKAVNIVRSMIDAGHARSVMGNHEFNAIGYMTERRGAPGEFLRKHSEKNESQHVDFLEQVGEGSVLHREMIEWFKSLPPMLDLGDIRVVHAWWHEPHVALVSGRVKTGSPMDEDFLHAAYAKGSAEWQAMEGLTKGLELRLPAGHSFVDHSGVERHDVRTKWWHEEPRRYRDVAILEEDQRHRVPDHELPPGYEGAPVEGSPVFIGHYWMSGKPELQSPKVACVDYSAAKDGPLVAYRWDGEQELDARRFVEAG
jgi:Calcineurin-like phosphoesterase